MKQYQTLTDRDPVVSGRFYAKTKKELHKELTELFEQAQQASSFKLNSDEHIRALICPHAGYLFSGMVAASAYSLLSGNTSFKHIFLLGSSHHVLFNGASVYYQGHYKTPLGKVPIDTELTNQLLQHNHIFTYNRQAHELEHTLEVQLPFLQYVLEKPFEIIPIILGSVDEKQATELAGILQPYFNKPDNLFIVSTDLSHYPNYNDAVKVDKLTINAICKNKPDEFVQSVAEIEHKSITSLSTCICGQTSVLTLLNITEGDTSITYRPILYKNSGDIPVYGDKNRVVGYQSVVVTLSDKNKNSQHLLNKNQQQQVLKLARDSIRKLFTNDRSTQNPSATNDIDDLKAMGAFVSLYVDEELRGCIGRIETTSPLSTIIHDMAVAAANSDSRFLPISEEELERLQIELSILSPLKKIDDISEIIPDKHGILIRKGLQSGTFLPQVGQRTGWSTDELLSKCAEGKAGLGRDGWRDADIFIYEAQVFSEKVEI